MSKRKPNISEIGTGFRRDCNDFFMYEIVPVAHRKHKTPFIFYRKRTAVALYYLKEVLEIAKDSDVIFKAWVGEWTTDIFAFTVGEWKQWEKDTNKHNF